MKHKNSKKSVCRQGSGLKLIIRLANLKNTLKKRVRFSTLSEMTYYYLSKSEALYKKCSYQQYSLSDVKQNDEPMFDIDKKLKVAEKHATQLVKDTLGYKAIGQAYHYNSMGEKLRRKARITAWKKQYCHDATDNNSANTL